jgi:two-component system OmpR family response regulator
METILVVDDDPMVRSLCQQMLNRGGYVVVPLSSGVEAVSVLKSTPSTFDLALLDVMMPGMNGIELANHIKKTHPGTRIVLMSGYGPREIEQVIGPNSYPIIWKPFKTESLLRMIENALGPAKATTA